MPILRLPAVFSTLVGPYHVNPETDLSHLSGENRPIPARQILFEIRKQQALRRQSAGATAVVPAERGTIFGRQAAPNRAILSDLKTGSAAAGTELPEAMRRLVLDYLMEPARTQAELDRETLRFLANFLLAMSAVNLLSAVPAGWALARSFEVEPGTLADLLIPKIKLAFLSGGHVRSAAMLRQIADSPATEASQHLRAAKLAAFGTAAQLACRFGQLGALVDKDTQMMLSEWDSYLALLLLVLSGSLALRHS